MRFWILAAMGWFLFATVCTLGRLGFGVLWREDEKEYATCRLAMYIALIVWGACLMW